MMGLFPIISYLRAGVLIHIITLLEIALLVVLGPKLLSSQTGLDMETGVNVALFCFLTMLPIMSQLDARSRFQEYKRIKDQLKLFGFDNRLLKPLVRSRCQRDAALAAACELGYGGHCRGFYHASGYRWYHLTPEFLFSNPRFLISRQFWENTFFLSPYPDAKRR